MVDTIREAPWSKEIMRTVTPDRINKFPRRLRSTQIDPTQYPSPVQILTDPIGADSLDKGKWAIWGKLTLKYNIQYSMAHIDIRATIMTLTQGSVKSPLDLANVAKNETIALEKSLLANGEATVLWRCAKFRP